MSLLGWVWAGRVELVQYSQALRERRHVTIFGAALARPPGLQRYVYLLDGDKHRHGLLPAAHGLLLSLFDDEPAPILVAVHEQGRRDVDFRPPVVRPAYWRPNISGRSPLFDRFLIQELRPEIEQRFGLAGERHLFGHSLAGFYALDMPTRQSQHGFDGLFAFSPTFSHDLSLIARLGEICAVSPYVYANIGLESARDTAVFGRAEDVILAQRSCGGKAVLSRHPGAIHQIVMLSGQIAAFSQIYWGVDRRADR